MDEFEKQEIQQSQRAAEFRAKAEEKYGIIPKLVDIYSDGTRMTGTLWRPKNEPKDKKLPAILMCIGFGAKRVQMDFSYASRFCQAGFVVLTFDYRGWGDSDGILVAVEKQPKPDANGLVTVKARPMRKIVDPEWQLRDCDSALNFLLSEPGVDPDRVGIWGSSFGSGYAIALAGRDPRVKCIVTQIGAINSHANWINRHPQYRGAQAIRELAAKHARGEVYPWDLSKPKGLDGMPNLPKTVFEHTITAINGAKTLNVPVMLLAAANEETFHNSKNSELVYNMIKDRVPAELDYLPGTHYSAYDGESYRKGVARALDWFRNYLGDHEMLAKVAAEQAKAAEAKAQAAKAAGSAPAAPVKKDAKL